METIILTAMDETATEAIEKAADILKSGGLVAIPTETVYGLAASAFSNEAVDKIYEAKGRPSDNPLIVHVDDFKLVEEIASEITPLAKKCMQVFWPGPFTAVVPKSKKIPNSVSGGLSTVAIRMPDNDVARAVIHKSGLPLAAPSANRSGSPSPSTAAHVIEDLSGRIDAIVVSNNCAVGVESTVVTFATNPPRLLRPGGVTVEQLKKYIPDLVIDPAVTSEPEKGAKVASPGMKYKHYAPKADITLIEGDSVSFVRYQNRYQAEFDMVLCYEEESNQISLPYMLMGKQNDYTTQAERLFSLLREIDAKGASKVLVHAPSHKGMGLAVYNRLIRAAGFKVVHLPRIIGLTGPSGTGKSSIASLASENGIAVINCDKVAALVTENKELLEKLEIEFSNVVIDGILDRKALANKAFATAEATERLNSIMLPVIVEEIEQNIDRLIKAGVKGILLDAPTLFESGLDKECSAVIAVLADETIRAERIRSRDELNEAQLEKRISAAKPDVFYLEKSTYHIYNNGNWNITESDAKRILKNCFEEC